MISIGNIWKKGFIAMLFISVLSLISTQIPDGIIFESKIVVRACFFLFMLLAIKFSSLQSLGKSIGYTIASIILLLAMVMTQTESEWLILTYTVLVTGFMIYIIALVINQIFSGGEITIFEIGGGVATYILLGQLWASVYLMIYILHPESFRYGGELIQKDEALKQLSYFSFVTLTTIGYGDITAMSSVARILVIMEGLLGQLFPAIFIAKLVTLQIRVSKK